MTSSTHHGAEPCPMCGAGDGDEHDLDVHEAEREAGREVERDGMREHIDNLRAEVEAYIREVDRLRDERDELQRRLDDQTERVDRHRALLGDAEAERDRLLHGIRLHKDHDFPEGVFTPVERFQQAMLANEDLWALLDSDGDSEPEVGR